MELFTPNRRKKGGSRIVKTKSVLMVDLASEPDTAAPTEAEASGNSQVEEANEEL